MNKKILLLFSACIFSLSIVQAQISITAADVNAVVAQGNSYTSYADSVTATANIGTPGMTSWNFAGITPNISFLNTSVNPATSAFSSDFPGANVCYYYNASLGGIAQETWQYFSLGTNYQYHGSGTSVASFNSETKNIYSPTEILYQFPLTLNTNWQQSYNQNMTSLFQGMPISNSTAQVSINYSVDAYGTLTLPSGASVEALRIRSDERYVSNSFGIPIYSRTISYLFLAKNGSFVAVSAADTLSPNSGTIPIQQGITWGEYATTGVTELNSSLPTEYSLEQNYPNPFNPTTRIRYSIPGNGFVTLKVYDIVGNQITDLISGQQSAGSYEYTFDASALASGIYFYTLKVSSADGARDFSETRKMMLIK